MFREKCDSASLRYIYLIASLTWIIYLSSSVHSARDRVQIKAVLPKRPLLDQRVFYTTTPGALILRYWELVVLFSPAVSLKRPLYGVQGVDVFKFH